MIKYEYFYFCAVFNYYSCLFAKLLFWGLKETWKTPGLGKDAFRKRDE